MSGNGNGNGKGKKGWNLAEHGILWKTVLEYATKDFAQEAERFVSQLQEAVQPADALQGLLLDRMAASHLRKQLVLEAEAAAREMLKEMKKKDVSGFTDDAKKRFVIALSQPTLMLGAANTLRYEALLDQSLHRDLILLQKLKEVVPPAPTTPARKSSDRALIEGGGVIV
jgi:hypothetical protein